MGVTCCGQERSSRYCPDCGEPLPAAAIVELLAHLRKNEKQRRNFARLWSEAPDPYPERVASCTAAADRWKSWAAAVEALMIPPGEEV